MFAILPKSLAFDQSQLREILAKAMTNKKPTAEQSKIAHEKNTEAPFSSPLLAEKRTGIYVCAMCATPLFSSANKYDSGSGWPSFFQPLNETALGTQTDTSLASPRTEVHCANCKAHMGHLFPDGPPPTGLRYCINGAVLSFEPDGET
ncbi:Peptide-methionine (R)-S-oxide reductase MsrB [hydrothermal vent metagenome]|uniref:peptide-methionine (R)-S-oxide reductase n=1 Tax=hydrothermal vent metagenome TaxID=652676 RepID=A0A3B0RXP1_9ZZZZ